MKRMLMVGSIACGALVLTGVQRVSTQGPQTPEALLGAAIHQDDAEGNLEAAIEGYQAFLVQFGDDRPLAVQALLRMGQAYETLGRPEARDAYERVLRDYADQTESVAAVRARLAALEVEPTSPSSALHTEMLWAEAEGVAPQGDVSPDGSLVTYVDWLDLGNLAIRNLVRGESRRLTHTAENRPNYAGESRMSPDGDQVAYTWFRPSPVGETGELRLLSVHRDQSTPRTMWSPADGSYASIQDWFPSGDRVVAVVSSPSSSSIVTVSTVDGRVQQVRSIEWSKNSQVRVSPDGRSLAYSRSVSRDVPEKDIFLVAVDGSSESVVVEHAAHDELVAWTPDGTHVLFNSDRSGQLGLWAQRVHDTKPVGEPQLLIANLDVGSGMGITRDGTLHYSVRVSLRRMKIAELDTRTGRLLRQPANVTDEFVGANTLGVFSPDGETLAYLRGILPGPRTIVIRSLETGEERDLPHELQTVFQLSWGLDSNHLRVVGPDDRGRYGQSDVNVATGQTWRRTDFTGILTPDGTQILHRDPVKDPDVASIYSYRVADGSVHALPGVFRGSYHFSLSPDGRQIASIGGRRSEMDGSGTELRLHPAVGGDGDVLWTADDDEPFGRGVTWTPDGTALLVHKKEPQAGTSMWRLWIVPVDGSDPIATELVHEPAGAFAIPLSLHPDGKRIVYADGGRFDQFWAVRNLALDQSDSPSR